MAKLCCSYKMDTKSENMWSFMLNSGNLSQRLFKCFGKFTSITLWRLNVLNSILIFKIATIDGGWWQIWTTIHQYNSQKCQQIHQFVQADQWIVLFMMLPMQLVFHLMWPRQSSHLIWTCIALLQSLPPPCLFILDQNDLCMPLVKISVNSQWWLPSCQGIITANNSWVYSYDPQTKQHPNGIAHRKQDKSEVQQQER